MKKWILISAALIMPVLLKGQIVNIEDKRVHRDTTGWFGRLDVGLSVVQNVASVLTINAASRIDYLRENSNWMLIGNYNRVRADKKEFVNDGFGHLRNGIGLTEWMAWENFVQGQYNERISLQFRGLVGTGPRFRLLERDKQSAYLGLLYMYEYDEVGEGDIFYRDHRISTYLSFKLDFTPSVSLSSTSYYQPVIKDFSDKRISSINTLNLKITTKLSFLSRLNLTHDARVARDSPEVPTTTLGFYNGLRVEF